MASLGHIELKCCPSPIQWGWQNPCGKIWGAHLLYVPSLINVQILVNCTHYFVMMDWPCFNRTQLTVYSNHNDFEAKSFSLFLMHDRLAAKYIFLFQWHYSNIFYLFFFSANSWTQQSIVWFRKAFQQFLKNIIARRNMCEIGVLKYT